MTDQYLARFRVGTLEQRRAAIIKIGKAGDPRAISLLQQITIGEPDPALQEIAFRAIHHLEGLVLAEPVNTLPTAPAIEPVSENTLTPLLPKVVVLPQEPLPGSKLNPVIALQMIGQFDDALLTLAEIVRTDPNVLNSTVGANLAMTLTDLPREQAIAAIIAKSKTIKVKIQKEANIPRASVEFVALFDTLLETAALVIMLFFMFAIVRVGIVSLANRMLTNLAATYGQSGASNSNTMAATIAQLTKGQVVDAATLNRLESQLQQGQFNPDSPQFRAMIISQLLSTFGQSQSTAPSTKTVILEAATNALHLLLYTVLTILATYLLGLILRGKGHIVLFFRAMTRAYLIMYGLVLAGLALWFLALQQPTMSATLQSVCVGVGLLLIIVSGLYGFKVQVSAASRAHQFGRTRGFIIVTVGSLVVTLIFSLSGLTAVLHALH
jgi:hypothetical protein